MTLTNRKGNIRGREFPTDTGIDGNACEETTKDQRWVGYRRQIPNPDTTNLYSPHLSSSKSVHPTHSTLLLPPFAEDFPRWKFYFPSWNVRCLVILFTIFLLWLQVLRKAPGPSLSGKYHPSNWCRGFRSGVIRLQCDCMHDFTAILFILIKKKIKFSFFVCAFYFDNRAINCVNSSFIFLALLSFL